MCTILVVDDCRETLESVAAMLEDSEHQVICTTEASRAKNICHEINFDVVLCDIIMDDRSSAQPSPLGGIGVISELTAQFANLPVIVMSGGLEETQLRKLKLAGVRGALSKPFSRERLMEELANCLNNSVPAKVSC